MLPHLGRSARISALTALVGATLYIGNVSFAQVDDGQLLPLPRRDEPTPALPDALELDEPTNAQSPGEPAELPYLDHPTTAPEPEAVSSPIVSSAPEKSGIPITNYLDSDFSDTLWGDAGTSLFDRLFHAHLSCPWGEWQRPPMYASAEYLFWWTRGQALPPLVTTSPVGTAVDEAGVLGLANTTTLFGGRRFSGQRHAGGRFRLGAILDPSGCNRLEVDYFVLDTQSRNFVATAPDDYAILARPFVNTLVGGFDSELVGYPNVLNGTIRVHSASRFFGTGIMFRHNLLCGGAGCCPPCGSAAEVCPDVCDQESDGGWRDWLHGMMGSGSAKPGGTTIRGQSEWAGGSLQMLDFLIGYRHYELDDFLRINEALVATDPGGMVPVGTNIDIFDHFRTENEFDGIDLGLAWDWRYGTWGVGMLGKAAFGNLQRTTIIRGSTTNTVPGDAPLEYSGGLLALDSNIGGYKQNVFRVVPEFDVNMYYYLRPNCRLTLGYTLIYLNNVVRPGGVVDLGVDPGLIPPPLTPDATRPAYLARQDDYWAQGLNLGVEFKF